MPTTEPILFHLSISLKDPSSNINREPKRTHLVKSKLRSGRSRLRPQKSMDQEANIKKMK